jgi:hypothetical protein
MIGTDIAAEKMNVLIEFVVVCLLMERITRSQLRQTLFQLNFLVVSNTFSRYLTLLAEPAETVTPADEDGDEARRAFFHMGKTVTTNDFFFRFQN